MRGKDGPLLEFRTWFSFLEGALSPAAACDAVVATGGHSLAAADINNLHALPEFVDAAEERALKPLAAAALRPDRLEQPLCTFYCKDRRGFERLCGILTRLSYRSAPPGPDADVFGAGRNYDPVVDLVDGGWDGAYVVSARPDVLRRLAAGRRSNGTTGELLTALPSGASFRPLRDLAESLVLKTVAVERIALIGPRDAARYRLLAAVARRTVLRTIGDELPADVDPSAPYFDPYARGPDPWSAFPESRVSARRIAEDCASAASFFSSAPVFPPYRGQNPEESAALLRRLCEAAVPGRYGAYRSEVRERLEKELAMIIGKGFASYFLTVRDIVGLCPRTCGRGSAAASIVSYLLGITQVDPIARGLFFERFLNEGREDPPDIDVDFPWDERETVIRRVLADHAGHAALVADHCTFARRSSLREAAIALGFEGGDLSRFALASRIGDEATLPADVREAAALLRGTPRCIGTHPGGVVITPRPLASYTQVLPAASGFPVIAWEKDGTERAGLVKIDLLGNRSLAVLRDTIELVGRRPDRAADPPAWNAISGARTAAADEAAVLADIRARALLESGDSVGIFYVESPATRRLLKRMRRADFEHLVVASSIIRPAANRWIDEYLRRLHGGSWEAVHPEAEATLAETLGVMVYQEDVVKVAMAVAGFSAAEADGLRKTLSKKNRAARLEIFRDRFFRDAASRGATSAAIATLWSMILSFDGYSFCKAHSASYALVSYRLAWLRVRYPLEFFASVLNNGGGFYGPQVYLDMVRRLGFPLLPPDVNESAIAYRCVSSCLRAGLSRIGELPAGMIEKIIQERERGGPFESAADFFARIRPDSLSTRALIRSGALDALPAVSGGTRQGRAALFWLQHHTSKETASRELFPAVAPPEFLRDHSPATRLADERRFLGVLLSRHPASLYHGRAATVIARRGGSIAALVRAHLLPARSGKRVAVVGVLAAAKEVSARTALGDRPMAFFSFGDETGLFETVFFPKAYERFQPMLETGIAFLVEGVVIDEDGAVSIQAENLSRLDGPGRPP